jgi:Glycosyltransferase family 29 (sialyltransferase)
MSLRGLLRAPSHMGTEKLRAMVDGKSVAVVGNASSLFGKNLGAEIDSHDVVIRLNRGFIVDPQSQGSRTDIAGTARPLTLEQVDVQYKPQLIYWLFWRLWHIPPWNEAIWNKTEVIPTSDWYAANSQLKGRPTSGFVMCHTLLKRTKPKALNVYGFDFYATPNYYRGPDTRKSVHLHDEEQNAFNSLMQQYSNAKQIR